ncbi:MAG TPA: S24 family peptidase [Rhodothermales bacterium]|nr:S24 family peptidase [Rhodothermales bacterium]
MTDRRLTERQLQVLGFIRDHIRSFQKPPTLKELADLMGIQSTNAVHKVIRILVDKGHLQKESRTSRGIRLTEDSGTMTDGGEIPVLPLVPAPPRSGEAWSSGRYRTIAVDAHLLRNAREQHCMVVVVGDDGMAKEGIRAGDWAVVETGPLSMLQEGEMVLAMIRERPVIRYLYAARWQVMLRPAEKRYTEEVFNTNSSDCYVVGRLIGLIRRY